MKLPILAALSVLFSFGSFASALALKKTVIELKVPYSFGTHKLTAKKLDGEFKWSEDRTQITKADLSLAVQDIDADDKTLKCHLMESLTLDYEKSKFPKKHVCEDDKLPSEGKDAPVYQEIKAHLMLPIGLGPSQAQIEWDIHGVKKEQLIPVELTLSEDKKTFSLKADWVMKRSDFGIVVKTFLFIDADDKLPVKVDIEGDVL